MKEFLIISPCGKDSIFTEWLSSESNFDLVLLYYDDDLITFEKFKEINEWTFKLKGEKWFLIKEFISQNFEFVSNYSYIWFPDDDISISPKKINELFEISKYYELWISQPSLLDNCSYNITKKHPSSYLRFTNYVEIMAPVIKSDIIGKIIHTFDINKSGWGIEFIWYQLLGQPKDKFAVIDRIVVNHLRPLFSNYSSERFSIKPENEFKLLIDKYSINTNKINISYIDEGLFQEFPNFLTYQECQELIGMAETKKYSTGKMVSNRRDLSFESYNQDHPDKQLGYRKAQIHWFDEDNSLVSSIKKRVANLSDITVEYQEKFHFVKYNSSGEYKPHFDSLNRIKTALIYLNDAYEGGETYFSKLDKKIKPETGKLVIWNNLLPNGKNRPSSFHCGLPVEFGTKYIAVIWIGSPLNEYVPFEDKNLDER